jgi:hypothetical protein
MKGWHAFLLSAVAPFGANADTFENPAAKSAAPYSASAASPAEAVWEIPERGPISTNPIYTSDTTNARALFASGQNNDAAMAAADSSHDDWLIALAAVGLVVLQLRRRHKSLPPRAITGW